MESFYYHYYYYYYYSAGGGSIESLYQWYKSLCEEGRKFGYIVNGAKSWLIVKTSELAESANTIQYNTIVY